VLADVQTEKSVDPRQLISLIRHSIRGFVQFSAEYPRAIAPDPIRLGMRLDRTLADLKYFREVMLRDHGCATAPYVVDESLLAEDFRRVTNNDRLVTEAGRERAFDDHPQTIRMITGVAQRFALKNVPEEWTESRRLADTVNETASDQSRFVLDR
jgi:hypothetical protein